MKKNFFVVTIILGLYAAFSIATSPKQVEFDEYNECAFRYRHKYDYDSFGNTSLVSYLSTGNTPYNNILLFRIIDTTKATKVADMICKQMKDSCGLRNATLIFYDTSWRTHYDSVFNISGKRVLTYNCP